MYLITVLIQAGETTYRYDAENQRIGVNGISFVINSQPALSQVLVKDENGVATYYVYGLGLIGEEKNGEYKNYHFDFRGSTVALSDSSGAVTERFQYGPYGELVSGDVSVTPFLFNGMYGVMTDSNGLYYMRARFYSAEIKRFLNRDVLIGGVARGQGLNRFAYVTGRVVNAVDPFGLYAVVMINTYGGEGFGHGAIAIQNRSNGHIEYYSYGPEGGGNTIDLALNLGIQGHLDYQSLGESDFINLTKKEGYNDFLIIDSNEEEEKNMLEYLQEFQSSVKRNDWWTRYRLYSNSCIDLVTDTLAEGINIGGLPGHLVIEGTPIPRDLIDSIISGLSPSPVKVI